jgi:hypothetical protein
MDHHAIRMLTDVPWKPWVMSGGSYSGALAAWTASIAPGTFWAYHASSAPVQAIYDFVRDGKKFLNKAHFNIRSGNISSPLSRACPRTAARMSIAW